MVTIKSHTDLNQSKKLAEILPLESADMFYVYDRHLDKLYGDTPYVMGYKVMNKDVDIPCWSLAALFGVLPEINGISLKIEKVKAEDGYDGYYYHIEYEGIVLIPYSKNPIDACYDMILKLKEQKLL